VPLRCLVESALAHVNGDTVAAAYQRSDRFEQRRRLMEAWGEYLTRPGQLMLAGRQRVGSSPKLLEEGHRAVAQPSWLH
jgi:hypothetical protein